MSTASRLNVEMSKTREERALDIKRKSAIQMDQIRPQLVEKSGNVAKEAHELYVAGRKFKVIQEGVRLEGIVTFGDSAFAGYAKSLKVGDIITCNGWRKGMNSDVMECNFTADGVPWNALWVQVWPMDGLWRPWPMKGFLELVEEAADYNV